VYIEIGIKRKPVFLPFIELPSVKPFFAVDYGDTAEHTIDSFLKAMRLDKIEDAKVYISRNYLDRVDLDELSDALLPGRKLSVSCILKTDAHKNTPKDCISKAFLVVDGKGASLFNINMLKEPNSFGKWKIYSIEREESAGMSVRIPL